MSWPPLEDEEAWRELVAWRHSEVNLNYLQIALLQRKEYKWKKLWNEHFLREELYRDENGRLVNHPLHLYEILDVALSEETIVGSYPSVNHIRDELFYEEGLVDLTMSKLQQKPSRPSQGQSDMDTSPSTTGPGQSGTQDLPPEDDRHHSAAGGNNNSGREDQGEKEPEEEHRGEEVDGSKNDSKVFATRTLREILSIPERVEIADHPQPIRLQPFSKDGKNICRAGRHLAQVVDKLCGSKGQLSTAELLCSMIGNLGDFTNMEEPIYYLNFVSIPQEYTRDAFLLQCQIVSSWGGNSFDEHLGNSLMEKGFVEDVLEGVRFLPLYFIDHVLDAYEDQCEENHETPDDLFLLALEDRLENFTLQDLCVIKIMRLMGGDARKVWSLEGIPVRVKELFHIPFGKRCEELKKRHEEPKTEEQE